jgi:hypothetical protein
MLPSPVSVESDSSSSENSDSEMTSIWADNKTPSIKEKHSQNHAELRQPHQWYVLLAMERYSGCRLFPRCY